MSSSDIHIEPSWKALLEKQLLLPYFETLRKFVRKEYLAHTIYPPPAELFTAFNLCPVEYVKVVILGQDPYHGPNQAHGLCFSVKPPTPPPPSLKNIFKEIEQEFGPFEKEDGDLTAWASQGVFMLNSVLTVQKGKAGSHQGKGWETFTDAVISEISKEKEHLVFLLWGNYAKAKRSLIDETKHLVLTASHPSPFSAYNGFFGCNHFLLANEYLKKHNKSSINWKI